MKPKKQLQEEAEARKEARANRSDADQLKLIETRRGESMRERKRIEARIARRTQKKARKEKKA